MTILHCGDCGYALYPWDMAVISWQHWTCRFREWVGLPSYFELEDAREAEFKAAFDKYLLQLYESMCNIAGLSPFLLGSAEPGTERWWEERATTSGYALNNLIQAARVRAEREKS